MPREFITQCWSCLGEFDAAAAVWCTCSARTPTKLCPFCFHCFCQADNAYQTAFWDGCPEEIREERTILNSAVGTIGEALIRSNLLNTGQLISALRWQQSRSVPLEEALVDLGFVSRENLSLVTKGGAQGGATVDLSRQVIDASLTEAISVDLCYRKRVLPVSRETIGETPVLTLAMAGPTDVETIDQVQTLTGCRIIPMSASEQDILGRLKELFPDQVKAIVSGAATPQTQAPAAKRAAHRAPPKSPAATPADPSPGRRSAAPAPARPAARSGRGKARGAPQGRAAAGALELEEIVEAVASLDDPLAEPAPATPAAVAPRPSKTAPAGAAAPPTPAGGASASPSAAAPIVASPTLGEDAAPADAATSLQKILADAVARRASMVQMEVRGTDFTLFYRIDGNLVRMRPPAADSAESLTCALAAAASLPPGDRPASGHMTLKAKGRKVEAVVRRAPFAGGESLSLRLIDPAEFLTDLDALGPSSLDRDRILGALQLPHGLILLSAPPYNDVEATRYALMAHLGREGRRVLAIESPQLVTIDGVRQQQVPFPPAADAVGQAIESSPGAEVLLLPDLESPGIARVALDHAAACLVISTVQARRASQTPAAVLWHQVDAAALAGVLRLVINQRLVRRICDGCRSSTQVADRVLKMMGLTPDESLDLKISQGGGCDRCRPLSPGYAGRVSLFEVLEGTPEVAALIARNAPPGDLEREARRSGMSPLRAACLAKVGAGVTTLEEFQKGNF